MKNPIQNYNLIKNDGTENGKLELFKEKKKHIVKVQVKIPKK